MRTFALWLHIAAAGLWLGANVVQAVVGPKLARDERAALAWFRAVQAMSGPVYGSAGTLILLTGLYLVFASDGVYSFGSIFVTIGLTVVIIGGALGGLVFGRKTKQMIGLLESGSASQVEPVFRSVAGWGAFDTALLLFALWAMVAKWGV